MAPGMETPLTTPVLAPDLKASIEAASAAMKPGGKGAVTFDVSRTGADVGLSLTPNGHVAIGGYAKRLWGGGWEAGAKGQITW